jgi:hypothetical protein
MKDFHMQYPNKPKATPLGFVTRKGGDVMNMYHHSSLASSFVPT